MLLAGVVVRASGKEAANEYWETEFYPRSASSGCSRTDASRVVLPIGSTYGGSEIAVAGELCPRRM